MIPPWLALARRRTPPPSPPLGPGSIAPINVTFISFINVNNINVNVNLATMQPARTGYHE